MKYIPRGSHIFLTHTDDASKINGKDIRVSEEVYREFKHSRERERFYGKKIKAEKEISYETLTEAGWEISQDGISVEDRVIRNCMLEELEKALHELSDEELELIQELFFLEKTEREAARLRAITQNSLNYRKRKILKKLREILENF